MSKVFISHSTQDRAFVEQEVVALLEGHGIHTWYAPDDVHSAEQWERSILQGLRECDCFLLVMSPRSARSPWVKREVDWVFYKGGKTVVPLLLEDCSADDFHIGLVSIQHVDFRHDRDAGRRALLRLWGKTPAVVVAEPAPPAVKVADKTPPPRFGETPLQFLKRVKAEAAAKMEQARFLLARYDYAAAVEVLLDFTPDQAAHRDDALLREATEKCNRLQALDRDIQKLYRAHKFHDPRLPVWVGHYLVLKPDDAEMRELLAELPPPNEPPASPKAGDVFTLQIVTPEPEHQPGEIVTVTIPPVDRGAKPGTLTALTWKPVPARPNPHK